MLRREQQKKFARLGLDMVARLAAASAEEAVCRPTLQYLRGFVDTLREDAIERAAGGVLENADDELRGLASLLDTRVSALESRLAGTRPN